MSCSSPLACLDDISNGRRRCNLGQGYCRWEREESEEDGWPVIPSKVEEDCSGRGACLEEPKGGE